MKFSVSVRAVRDLWSERLIFLTAVIAVHAYWILPVFFHVSLWKVAPFLIYATLVWIYFDRPWKYLPWRK
jgi:hypothetical protein